MRPIRFLPFLAIHSLIGVVLLIVATNAHVVTVGREHVYRSVDTVPRNKTALLLGTSQYVASGGPNPFFAHRISAAVELYEYGRVDYIIASGDNRHRNYNEPIQMKRALMAAGVPEDAIILDYAGFRTLDSVVRAAHVFGQQRFTIVSQEFHNRRALYIAAHYALEAVGYSAQEVPGYTGFRIHLREILARTLAVLDLHMLRTEPRFLGEPVMVP